ncbi:hypothetical protein B0H11DRAFT_1627870, partial [Mycena galericulata]
SRYIIQLTDPSLTRAQIERDSNSFEVPFNAVPVFQKIKFTTSDPYSKDGPADNIVDSIHINPPKKLPTGDQIPARFDTALVNTGDGGLVGSTGGVLLPYHGYPLKHSVYLGYRIAQVRVVFSLPPRLARTVLPPNMDPPKHLAYVEWFSPFKSEPERYHSMYKVTRSVKNGSRLASIGPNLDDPRIIH